MSDNVFNDGLPEPIFLAVSNDKYDPGRSDYTPSSLIAPAYQRKLIRENRDKIKIPASSRIWALLGSAVHYMIELAGEKAAETYECERRFYGEIDVPGYGIKTVGAQVDILQRAPTVEIHDMKTTGVYAAQKEAKDEWIQQLNLGRWCVFRETGILVEKLNIVGIWRDWRKRDIGQPGYPQTQVSSIPLEVWSLDRTEAWIVERIIEREIAAEQALEDALPCSREDMWAKPDKWAIKKPGGSRARKVCDDELEAVNELKAGEFIEERPGERTRCAGYCDAANICPVWLAHRMKHGI